MLASQFSDNITALAILTGAIFLPIVGLAAILKMKTLSTEVKGVKVQMSSDVRSVQTQIQHEVTKPLNQINKAVNHTPVGELPLVQKVQQLENKLDSHMARTEKYNQKLAERLGVEVDF